MRMPLNPDDLVIETIVLDPTLDESSVDSQLWYTNTQPVPRLRTNETSCYV